MPEPSKWALLIGIDRYHESLGSLKYAGADCRALRETLVSGPLGFPEDQVLLLDDSAEADRRPTFANIHNTLGAWLAAPKPDDLVVVYFAGHGRLVDGKTYLVPGDATLSSIHTLGIPLPHVQDVLERCKAKRKMLVLDACHSGSGRDVAAMPGGMTAALAAGTGFYTISSCGAEERSHEWDEVGHGVFSHFLTEALRGGCSPAADGRLTVDGVYEWVHDRVAKWAAQHRCAQTPQRFAQGAGALVISQSAPDYAALAEQYRREAEEARARLAEAELRKLKSQVAESALKESSAKPKSVRVSKLSDWLRREIGAIVRDCSEAYARASTMVKNVPWPFWLFVALIIPASIGIAAWAHAARNASDDAMTFYLVGVFGLACAFGFLVAIGGDKYDAWKDDEGLAGYMGFMAGLFYAVVAFASVALFWPFALLIPCLGTFFVVKSIVKLFVIVLIPVSVITAAWSLGLQTSSGNPDIESGYAIGNLIMVCLFGILIAFGGQKKKNWGDGHAGLMGFMASVFYGMIVVGGYFFWPIVFALPLIAILLAIPENYKSR